MSKPRILVTGATGRTGGVVARELHRAGFPIRVLLRRDGGRAQAFRAAGIEVAFADISDAERVRDAMTGVSRAYFLPPFDANLLQGAAVFAAAAADARIESITAMSQWLASPAHPSNVTRQLWLMEKLFAQIPGVGITILNPGIFADSPYLDTIDYAVRLGLFPFPFGDSRNAPPSVDDIGRVAAAALADPDRHAGQHYRPTGPEIIGAQDMAAALTRVTGHHVAVLPMPRWMFLKAARLDGFPDAVLAQLGHYIEDHRQGAFTLGAPNDVVRAVTGRAPESFETVAARHAARVKRGWSASAAQLLKFLSVPLVPGFSAARWSRELRLPQPHHVQWAVDSPIWRHEHGIAPSVSAQAEAPTPRPLGLPNRAVHA